MVLSLLSLHFLTMLCVVFFCLLQVVEEIMPCPLCGIELPQYALITHASSCGEIASN